FCDLVTLDVLKMKFQSHRVLRLEDCSVCGHPAKPAPPHPIALRSVKKIMVSAETTYRNYEHHISPITGIVDQVEAYSDNERDWIHSFVAGHLFLPNPGREELTNGGLRRVSAGKGMTAQQARTGALCEALERYSGVFRGNEFALQCSYREL